MESRTGEALPQGKNLRGTAHVLLLVCNPEYHKCCYLGLSKKAVSKFQSHPWRDIHSYSTYFPLSQEMQISRVPIHTLIIFRSPYCRCMKSNTSIACLAEGHVQVQITSIGRVEKNKTSFFSGYFKLYRKRTRGLFKGLRISSSLGRFMLTSTVPAVGKMPPISLERNPAFRESHSSPESS